MNSVDEILASGQTFLRLARPSLIRSALTPFVERKGKYEGASYLPGKCGSCAEEFEIEEIRARVCIVCLSVSGITPPPSPPPLPVCPKYESDWLLTVRQNLFHSRIFPLDEIEDGLAWHMNARSVLRTASFAFYDARWPWRFFFFSPFQFKRCRGFDLSIRTDGEFSVSWIKPNPSPRADAGETTREVTSRQRWTSCLVSHSRNKCIASVVSVREQPAKLILILHFSETLIALPSVLDAESASRVWDALSHLDDTFVSCIFHLETIISAIGVGVITQLLVK